MKIEKKYIIAGVLGVVSIAVALAYLQYKKLMDYTIKLKGLKLKTLSAKNVAFDLFLNFTNNSSLKFDIVEQQYKVYLNDSFVTELVNYSPTNIMPKATSVIGINVSFDPTKVLNILNKNYASILLHPETVKIKVDVKLKVLLYGFKVSIPFVFEDTLKGLIDLGKQPKV
jgi:LEA14-like dessication related protein